MYRKRQCKIPKGSEYCRFFLIIAIFIIFFFPLVESTAVLGEGRGECECMCVVGERAEMWVTLDSSCIYQAD